MDLESSSSWLTCVAVDNIQVFVCVCLFCSFVLLGIEPRVSRRQANLVPRTELHLQYTEGSVLRLSKPLHIIISQNPTGEGMRQSYHTDSMYGQSKSREGKPAS